jgi:histidinol-phosphate aminotransferase
MKLNVPEYIKTIEPYKPGKPLEELEREYGIRRSIKLASNENPLGPSPKAVAAIRARLDNLHRYPDGSAHDLLAKLSDYHGLATENIILGNGSDEIIGLLAQCLLEPGSEVLLPQPSFLMYEIATRSVGAVPVFIPLDDNLSIGLEQMFQRITPQTRMVFLCNPNNPTGTVFSRNQLETFLNNLPQNVIVVIDEAYIEFVRNPDCAKGIVYIDSDRTVVTLRTFSKAYGLAGLRIGYGLMPTELSGYLNRIRMPFNTSSAAQAGAAAALDDEQFLQASVRLVHEGLDYLGSALKERGIRSFPTESNFFLIDVARNADEVFEQMLRRGVIVRSMSSYGYPQYIRVNVGLPEENTRFIKALEKVLTGE